jgi:hypothetical protein
MPQAKGRSGRTTHWSLWSSGDPSPQVRTESCHFFETFPTSAFALLLVSCNVRYWHKAEMLNALTNVRFWG